MSGHPFLNFQHRPDPSTYFHNCLMDQGSPRSMTPDPFQILDSEIIDMIRPAQPDPFSPGDLAIERTKIRHTNVNRTISWGSTTTQT